jgi:hypothetical protein
MRCLATSTGSSCSSSRFVSFTSPIDPLVCTPKLSLLGYCFATMFVCADTLAFSPLLFQQRTRDLAPSSPSRPPTRINDYYHLIYVLYAYRSLSRPFRCLISASGQLSAALRPYPRSNRAHQRNTCGGLLQTGMALKQQSTSNPCSPSLDFFLGISPDLLMRFGRSCLSILVSSVAWLVRAR